MILKELEAGARTGQEIAARLSKNTYSITAALKRMEVLGTVRKDGEVLSNHHNLVQAWSVNVGTSCVLADCWPIRDGNGQPVQLPKGLITREHRGQM